MSEEPPSRPDRLQPLEAIAAHIPGRADELVIDRLTGQLDATRRVLLGDPEAAAERALDRLANKGKVEARISVEMAMREPLGAPDRFLDAHRLAMRALEVLDREGSRDPGAPRGLGPLKVVAERVIEMVAEYIVRSYTQGTADSIRRLYARREAQAAPGTPERRLLARARVDADRVAAGYSGGGINGAVLVAAGAAIPALASVTSYLGAIDFTQRSVLFLGMAILAILFFGISTVLLRGAAVARHRSRLIMAEPLEALWETIGQAGRPPDDDSVMIATVAITITGILWLAAPAGVAVVILVG